jgi:Cytochrome C oxidase, cbb3-type, subunit III
MRTFGVLAVVWMTASSFLAAAPGGQQSAYSGTSDFQTYCTSCHGTEGKGDGLIAKSLPKHPPDLTKISARHDGAFPREQIFKTIEGRSGAHTNVDMPVWADVFAKSQSSLGNDAAVARIEALVAYLVTLQDKK